MCAAPKLVAQDSDQDEFKIDGRWIDTSQNNKFDESLLFNSWILSKVTYETYIDGVLTRSSDQTGTWGKSVYTFRGNHSMTFGKDASGVWLYAHNYLFMRYYGSCYYEYEVVGLKDDLLRLKQEDYPLGGNKTPEIKDKSGEHNFFVFEYVPR